MNSLTPELTEELFTFGEEIISQSRELILGLWNDNALSFELKEDRSPVSEVDLQAERLIRSMIANRYPHHGIIGEEFGESNPESEFQWTVDPIDGTENLVNRIPTFGTLLGLRYRGEAILGFIDHPALGLTVKGGRGIGVTYGGMPVPGMEARGEEFQESDLIALAAPSVFQQAETFPWFLDAVNAYTHSRVYYDCYSHSLTIGGSIAACLEAHLKIWDITPAEALILELGGEFRSLQPSARVPTPRKHNVLFGRPAAVRAIASVLG